MTTAVKRDATFDLVKGIAIFSVLWGHVIQYLIDTPCYENTVYRIIYSSHMPLFMTVVGYFGSKIVSRTFLDAIKQKCIQLLPPSISVGLIICVLMKCEWGIFDTLIYGLWFLKSAFLCFIVYYIAAKNNKTLYLGVLLTLVCSQFIYIYQFNLMYSCFIFGVILHKYWSRIKPYCASATVITGTIFIIMLIPWNDGFWKIPSGGIYPLHSLAQYKSFIWQFYYRLIIGYIGTVFFITLSQTICDRLSDNAMVKMPLWGKTRWAYIFCRLSS